MGSLQRIKEFIDYKGITNKAFEVSVGLSNGSFGSQLRNNRTIGVDRLENILLKYPELNGNWILTGEGSMLKSDISSGNKETTEKPEKEIRITELKERIEELKERIAELNRYISNLEDQLKDRNDNKSSPASYPKPARHKV